MKTITGILFAAILLSACNTIHGMGQDLERGGEKVKDAATSVQQKL
ncbi:entericidin A/B family lipoprotein [Tolumonas lignilytica]|jgi:Predicted small secreted protein|nr:entericidin A/B family lipoprotein [Tolumonas lignilytica]